MWRSCRIRFRSGVMPKAPFVFDHTPKDSPLEGVTITAGAQAAVRQPSTPASGRGDAREGGDSCAIPHPFQRREVGVRTSHTTAAERLSSMPHIVPYPKLRLAIPSADRKWRDHWCVGLFKLPHKGNQVIPKRWVRLPPRTRGRARNGDSGSECTRSSGATRRRCRAGGEARLFRIVEEP